MAVTPCSLPKSVHCPSSSSLTAGRPEPVPGVASAPVGHCQCRGGAGLCSGAGRQGFAFNTLADKALHCETLHARMHEHGAGVQSQCVTPFSLHTQQQTRC